MQRFGERGPPSKITRRRLHDSELESAGESESEEAAVSIRCHTKTCLAYQLELPENVNRARRGDHG